MQVLERGVSTAADSLGLPPQFPDEDGPAAARMREMEPLDDTLVSAVADLDAQVDELAGKVREAREKWPLRTARGVVSSLDRDAAEAKLAWSTASSQIRQVTSSTAAAEQTVAADVVPARVRRDKMAQDARRVQLRLEELPAKITKVADMSEMVAMAMREAQQSSLAAAAAAAADVPSGRLSEQEGGDATLEPEHLADPESLAPEEQDVVAARRVAQSLRRSFGGANEKKPRLSSDA